MSRDELNDYNELMLLCLILRQEYRIEIVDLPGIFLFEDALVYPN
jgi:hypothetical protein